MSFYPNLRSGYAAVSIDDELKRELDFHSSMCLI